MPFSLSLYSQIEPSIKHDKQTHDIYKPKNNMLMIKKQFYTSPEVDVFLIRPEGVICTSDFGDPGAPGDTPDWYNFFEF